MKTILLWDPRLPTRPPQRLTVEDAIASAAVRSGVAAPADPADAAGLLVGGPLDGITLTRAVLQTARGGSVRVIIPTSVLSVAIGLGMGAAVPGPSLSADDSTVPTGLLGVRARTVADFNAFNAWLGSKADLVIQFCESGNGSSTWAENLAIVDQIVADWAGIDVRHEFAFPGCSTTQPMSETVAGLHDATIRAMCERLAVLVPRGKIFLRGPWEGNNPRAYPWSWTAAGASVTEFKAAFRRIAFIAKSVSPRFMVGFVVLPSTLALDGTTVVDWTEGYPGDDAADYIGCDPYYDAAGELAGGTHIQRFHGKWNAAFGPAAVAAFAAARGKPFTLSEWGINADAPDYIDAVAATLRQLPNVLFANYFDVNVNMGQFKDKISDGSKPLSEVAFRRNYGPLSILTPAAFSAPTGSAFATKLEGNKPLRWSIVGAPGPFTIAIGVDGRTTRLLAPGQTAGAQTVTVRATDERGQTVDKTLTVNFAAAAMQPEAQFYATRAAAVPITGYQAALNAFVTGLKAGPWDFLDDMFLLQGMETQMAAASLISLRRAGAFVGSTTFTPKGGARSDGSTGYFDTLFQPSLPGHRYQRDDQHFGIWSLTNVPRANNTDAFEFGAGGTVSISRVSNGNIVGRPGSAATSVTLAGAGWAGHTMEVRTGPAAWRSYRKGAPALSGTEASAQQPYETFKALAAQIANGQFGANDLAFVHYGSGRGWTDANVASFHSLMDMYRQAVLVL